MGVKTSRLDGEPKAMHGDFSGVYIHKGESASGRPYWQDIDNKHAIWLYDVNWWQIGLASTPDIDKYKM